MYVTPAIRMISLGRERGSTATPLRGTIVPSSPDSSYLCDFLGPRPGIGLWDDRFNDMRIFQASGTVWRSVLAGCRLKRNLEISKHAAEKLISLQPVHSAACTLLSNIYAAAGKWKEKSEIRKLMDERKVKKEVGCTWIEVKKRTYTFLAGDSSHPLPDRINEKLSELLSHLKNMGYRPDTDYLLHVVEDEYKEAILWRHSEKLALAFGLNSTSQEAFSMLCDFKNTLSIM